MNDRFRQKFSMARKAFTGATYFTEARILSVMSRDLTIEIVNEIAAAVRKLGGNPATVKCTDAYQVNRVLAFLGADIYLLTTVGSWGDTQSDEQTLLELRDWNARGKDALIGTSLVPEEWRQI